MRNKGKSLIDFPNDFTVIDLETTGLCPEIDAIIEMSAIKVRNGVAVETYSTLVKPCEPISEYIAELTGITNEMVENSPTITNALPIFLDFVGSDIVVGHNVNFDVNFLYDKRSELFGGEFCNDYIDTLRIARRLFPNLKHHRLQDIAEHLSVANNDYHRALNDCQVTLDCYNDMKNIAFDRYGSAESFAQTFISTKGKLDLQSISTDKTEFDETHPLFGKVCVFTGKLERYKREDAARIVVSFGGTCGNNVTAKTNFLILGNGDYCSSVKDGKSTKHKKAEALKLKGNDIEIISENVFYDMLEN